MKHYIAFFIAYPWQAHNQVELVIASAIKNDSEIKSIGIYCDGKSKEIQKSCEIVIGSEHEEAKEVCKRCNKINREFFCGTFDKEIDLSENKVSSENSNSREDDQREEMGELANRQVISPELSRHRSSSTDELREKIGEKELERLIDLGFSSARESKNKFKECLAKTIGTNNFARTKVVTFNGRFHPYQGVLRACEELKIEYVLHERGTLPSTWRMSKNTLPMNTIALSKYINNNINKLNSGENTLSEFIEKRRTIGQQNFLNFTGHAGLNEQTQEIIKNGTRSKVVTLFTSGLDEICIFDKNLTYKAQLNLIEQCAQECNKIGWELIVRQHPNLGKIGSPTKANAFLEKCRVLQSNYKFIIISEQEKLHWEELAKIAMLNIVPYSSLILDMIYLGYPVASGPNPQFSDIITRKIDWSLKNNSLIDIAKIAQHILMSKEQVKRAEIYAQFYYIDSCISIEPARITKMFGTEISRLSKQELKHASKSNLDLIKNFILKSKTEYPIRAKKHKTYSQVDMIK